MPQSPRSDNCRLVHLSIVLYTYPVMKGIHKQTYGDQITEYIKACILNGEFKPGDKINEVDLATRLKVSRAPVREALQHLTQTGLLISVPQKGKFIAALTAKEIEDSYFTGGVLEGAAVAETASLFTDDDITALTRLVRDMDLLAKEAASMEKIAALDDAFHERLFSRCDNFLLRRLSRRSCQGISKFLLYKQWCNAFKPEEMAPRHQIVLDAVLSRDPARIERALREHYKEAGRRMAVHGSDIFQTKNAD
ncbi:MAG: HTH-type transcriptional repressor RspR [Desulfovibrio sp.]